MDIKDISLEITEKQGLKKLVLRVSTSEGDILLEKTPEEINAKIQQFKDTIQDYKRKTKIFKINKYITLKLENNETRIYVNGRYFRQCIRLFLDIPLKEKHLYDEINSIDQAFDVNEDYSLYQNRVVEGDGAIGVTTISHSITPEEEFRGHCSNLQAWAESNYDSRLLYRNMAFPLLKELADLGDLVAKNRFKEEIALRLDAGEINVFLFFLEQKYLSNLTKDELLGVSENTQNPIMKLFIRRYLNDLNDSKSINYYSLGKELSQDYIREINSLFLYKENILICPFDLHKRSLVNVRGKSFYNEYYPEKSIHEKIKYKLVYADTFLDFEIPSNTNRKIVYSLNYIKKVRGILDNNPDMTISIPKKEGPLRISSQKEGLKIYIQPEIFY